ncbi:MAG: hypothetical protein SYR96_34230 [Actinomycetota bacterium]|nr:hypothetical protein [Actinomycetota bacterium]
MTDETEGTWRDESKLPLSELTRAMASNSQDGQVDDLTGEDAGAASAPDPDRPLRPSPDGTTPAGRSGPN